MADLDTAPPITQVRKETSAPTWWDLCWVTVAVGLFGSAGVVGVTLKSDGVPLYLGAPPLFADWQPHWAPASFAAIGLAGAALVFAQRLLSRSGWRTLMWSGYVIAVGWTLALALIDGWQRGVASRLADPNEYLHDLPRIESVGTFLSTFTQHIVDFRPGSWTTHVSSHPPGATLFFLALDRLGLRGGGWAGIAVIGVGSLAAVAIPVTLRILAGESAARRVWQFLVFLPGAVWLGVSADGMFYGVSTCGIALVTLGAVSIARSGWLWSMFGGLLLGCSLYLSYGLALLGVLVAAVMALTVRRGAIRKWLLRWAIAAVGVSLTVVVFEAGGFSWAAGLSQLHVRYYQGIAAGRPYSYFVWANLATLVVSAGPAVAVSIARAVSGLRHHRAYQTPAVLTLAALLAVLAADLTGLSKAETERIWLPFAGWLLCGLAALPSRRARVLLAGQLAVALLVNHLLLTNW